MTPSERQTIGYAATALQWVEENMANYSKEAKATVMASIVQSLTLSSFDSMTGNVLAVSLEGADRNPISVNADVTIMD
jgi:hypothetical protein